MNSENLTQEELKLLHSLLGRILEEPKQKVYLDPVNQMIDDILDEFDFHKVHKAMKALDWRWVGNGVPTIDELRNGAHHLLRGAANSRLYEFKNEHWLEGIVNSTGGFQATAYCNESKSKIIRLDLKFVLTEWDESVED
jgi:hypothetical protein